VEDLSPYDRATLGLWRRSYTLLTEQPEDRQLVEAAMHAVLAGLRRWSRPAELFTAYEEGTAADFALARSVLPADASEELLWRVREAAFYLRYLELTPSSG
jgi:hypothetical protein